MLKAIKRFIKIMPIIGKFAVYMRGKITKYHSDEIYVFERKVAQNNTSENIEVQKVKNLLNYTKAGNSKYSAMQYPAGYHSFDLPGTYLKGQRDPRKRLNLIPYDFYNSSVLDIGCNQGGMLFGLDKKIKWGVGIDYDHRMVNVANRIKSVKNVNNTFFYVFDLENEQLDLIYDFLPEDKVDFVFLLSICMWIKNWKSVVRFGKELSSNLIFETNGTKIQQEQQIETLKYYYGNVMKLSEHSHDDPGNKKRVMLYCN